jgi:antitoxin component YwqK of YwqJK toxin-antitoxin module
METVNLNELITGENGIYLRGITAFSGFAIETFPDGRLQAQMSLMRGIKDGVTRQWHPNGQLESEKSFRNGVAYGRNQELHPDGSLKAESTWNAGECVHARQFDEQGRPILEVRGRPRGDPQTVTYHYYGIGNAGDTTGDPPAVIYRYDEAGNRIDDAAGSADTSC